MKGRDGKWRIQLGRTMGEKVGRITQNWGISGTSWNPSEMETLRNL